MSRILKFINFKNLSLDMYNSLKVLLKKKKVPCSVKHFKRYPLSEAHANSIRNAHVEELLFLLSTYLHIGYHN